MLLEKEIVKHWLRPDSAFGGIVFFQSASLAEQKTPHRESTGKSQCSGRSRPAADRGIDQLVYKLCGLTEEEIKIVEGA